MSLPLVLEGLPTFSAFREAALLEEIRRVPSVRLPADLTATTVFFIDADALESDASSFVALANLLDATGPFRPREGFFVTPRRGTISPWSSKATDILHNCGITSVRRVERGIFFELKDHAGRVLGAEALRDVLPLLHDRMTEGVYADVPPCFEQLPPAPMRTINVLRGGQACLAEANRTMGLALSDADMDYLCTAYNQLGRNPTDVELVMFGQVNSEHCRHKIFNADWILDGAPRDRSLFAMIRHTHARHPAGTLSAYADNSAVIEGFQEHWFECLPGSERRYGAVPCRMDILMKVETHNHPTAICPFPGAATGVGGEIRDEAATGTGGRSKAGLSAFFVSHLRLPGFAMPWEVAEVAFPGRLATPLDIMTQGPLGGARFGNEFGRPQLCGVFRTLETRVGGRYRGYHKPIMVAGGMGNIKREHVAKHPIPEGAPILQIGGPAMRIGLGGGAASSMATGSNAETLDFDSVQRDNAEMERRCQGVIDACIALGAANPILSIHDLGAGGLSNGCPELVSETGGHFQLRAIHNEAPSMSPMEIWCCEAQERYVLGVEAERLEAFLALCARERCPAAVIGRVAEDGQLVLEDAHFANQPIHIPIDVILGKPPRMLREAVHVAADLAPLDLSGIDPTEALERVLRWPAVARKTFLITITDRSVTGLVARDQMVGPWQTPLSDVAVTTTAFDAFTGEAMAMGERTAVALVSPPASGRLAVAEAVTNLAAAAIGSLDKVRLSANWMCACGEPGEDAALFDTVEAVAMALCPALGISIPVGKDSLSMRTVWEDSNGQAHKQTAPLSLTISAFAPVTDVRKTVTPDLKPVESRLLLLDFGQGRNRLGSSALAQVYVQIGDEAPDLDDPALLARGLTAVQTLVQNELLLAYHDRSDGGLAVTLAEMALGGRCGFDVDVANLGVDELAILFAEELGVVLQVAPDCLDAVRAVLAEHALDAVVHELGAVRPGPAPRVTIRHGERCLVDASVTTLNGIWSELTERMQARRDNPDCAAQEYAALADETDPGLQARLTFDPAEAPTVSTRRPLMAILREQGVNGHVEMAAAFDRAGFDCRDVHMTDLQTRQVELDGFSGLVACGGFSYGDVLGAGSGWAKSILFHPDLKAMFARFFARPDTFALGVCNGCQMLAQLKNIIPGAEHWPAFTRNRSEQFEARLVTVEVLPSPSVLLAGMEGSCLPIPVAHGEGLADFARTGSREQADQDKLPALRYVDNHGQPTENYPLNPNGSPGGLTGLASRDGRVTIMMPHPERAFRGAQLSYNPSGMFPPDVGPWLKLFRNARAFVG